MSNEQNELAVIARDSELEPTQVEALLANFGSAYSEAKELATGATDIVVTDEDQTDLMSEARKKRLSLRNVRVGVENTRKKLKEQSLREGKAIDGMANIIKALIVPVEEHLEQQEKFAELKRAERKAAKHAERIEQLSQYVSDVRLYSLEDMVDATFTELLASSKKAFEDQQAAQAKAEADRIAAEKADAEERERIRLENIKLREEAVAKDAALQAERKKREDAERAEKTRIHEAESLEREKREEAERAEAERIAEAEKSARQALLAPDKVKLLTLAAAIDGIELPNVSSHEAGKLLDETQDFLTRISKNLKLKAEEL